LHISDLRKLTGRRTRTGDTRSEAQIKAQAIAETAQQLKLTAPPKLPKCRTVQGGRTDSATRRAAARAFALLMAPLPPRPERLAEAVSAWMTDAPASRNTPPAAEDSQPVGLTGSPPKTTPRPAEPPAPPSQSLPLLYTRGARSAGVNINDEFGGPRFFDAATERWRAENKDWR